MSWASKAHKKYQVEKLVKEVLRNPEYKKMQQQEELKCFSCLALISVDFMMRKHGYSKKRILEYVEFLKRQLSYVTEDEEYFKLLNLEIEKDTGVNVLRNWTLRSRTIINHNKRKESGDGEIIKQTIY